MSKALVTISFTVGIGYRPGDYALLYGNGGSGSIDWDTALNGGRAYDLFPNNAGLFGYGHAPYGHHPYGKAAALRTSGYGHHPYGHGAYGHGSVTIEVTTLVTTCGTYLFGFKCYDAAENAHVGTPAEVVLTVCIAPNRPTGLKLSSYDKDTDVLVLDVA